MESDLWDDSRLVDLASGDPETKAAAEPTYITSHRSSTEKDGGRLARRRTAKPFCSGATNCSCLVWRNGCRSLGESRKYPARQSLQREGPCEWHSRRQESVSEFVSPT